MRISKPKLKHFLNRVAAVFLTISLLFSSAGQAAPVISNKTESTPSVFQTAIPKGFGKVEESFAGTSGKTIYYIQDAHDSLDAQKHIAGLIRHFVKREGVRTVFEEGYEGPVPIDNYFGFIKNPKIREKVSYFLMDKLRLGGAEYAHVNRSADSDFKLIGADSLTLHRDNIRWYQKNSRAQQSTSQDLAVLQAEIEKIAQKHLPKKLKDWIKLKKKFDRQELGLLDYLQRTNRLGIPFDNYPHISLILAAGRGQDSAMKQKIVAMDAKELFEEIESLETQVGRLLGGEGLNLKIVEYFRMLELYQRLNQISVTPAEYQGVKGLIKNFDTGKIAQFIVSQTKKSLAFSARWEAHIQNAVQFYETAHARDKKIEENLQAFLQNPDERKAVLVFGGFHKDAIKQILTRQNFSWAVITPKISQLDSRHSGYYKQLMSVGHHAFEKPFILNKAARAESIVQIEGHSEIRALYEAAKILDSPLFLSRELLVSAMEREIIQKKRQPSRSETRTLKIQIQTLLTTFEREIQSLPLERFQHESLLQGIDNLSMNIPVNPDQLPDFIKKVTLLRDAYPLTPEIKIKFEGFIQELKKIRKKLRHSERIPLNAIEEDFVQETRRDVFGPSYDTGVNAILEKKIYTEESLNRKQVEAWGEASIRERVAGADGNPSVFYSLSAAIYPQGPEAEAIRRHWEKIHDDFKSQRFAKKFYVSSFEAFNLTLRWLALSSKTPYPKEKIEAAEITMEKISDRLQPFDIWIQGLSINPENGQIIAEAVFLNERISHPRFIPLFTPFHPLDAKEINGLISWIEENRDFIFGRIHVKAITLVHSRNIFAGDNISKKEYRLEGGRSEVRSLDKRAPSTVLEKIRLQAKEKIEEVRDEKEKSTIAGLYDYALKLRLIYRSAREDGEGFFKLYQSYVRLMKWLLDTQNPSSIYYLIEESSWSQWFEDFFAATDDRSVHEGYLDDLVETYQDWKKGVNVYALSALNLKIETRKKLLERETKKINEASALITSNGWYKQYSNIFKRPTIIALSQKMIDGTPAEDLAAVIVLKVQRRIDEKLLDIINFDSNEEINETGGDLLLVPHPWRAQQLAAVENLLADLSTYGKRASFLTALLKQNPSRYRGIKKHLENEFIRADELIRRLNDQSLIAVISKDEIAKTWFVESIRVWRQARKDYRELSRSEVRNRDDLAGEDEAEQHHFRVESMIEFYPKDFLLFAEDPSKPGKPNPAISRYYSRPAETGPPNVFRPGVNKEHDRRVSLILKAIDWMKKRAQELQDPVIRERAERIGTFTTVISVNAPTRLFVYSEKDARMGVYHISRRRSAVHFPALFLDLLDANNEQHIEEIGLYLDRAQRWIDAYEEAEKNVRQVVIKPEDVPERMVLARSFFEEQDRKILGDDKKLEFIFARLKEIAAMDQKEEPERITEIRILHEAVANIERDLARKPVLTRDDFHELATYYGRLAHLQENAGSHEPAIRSYLKQVEALHQLQVYDTGQLPIKIQKDIIRILLRAGLDEEFLKELNVFLTGHGFPPRSDNPAGLWPEERRLLADEIDHYDAAFMTELISVLWEKKSLMKVNVQNTKAFETNILKLFKDAFVAISSGQWEEDSQNSSPRSETRSGLEDVDVATVLTRKFDTRFLLEGGPIRQPEWFVTFTPLPSQELEPSTLNFSGEKMAALYRSEQVRDFASIASDIVSGKISLPVVYKHNTGALGLGIFFLEKNSENDFVVTMARTDASISSGKYSIDARVEKYLNSTGKLKSTKNFPDQHIVQFVFSPDDAKEILSGIWKTISTDSFGHFDAGMMESMYQQDIRSNGLRYETRHSFEGKLGSDSDFKLKPTGVEALEGGIQTFARLGTSGYFSNYTMRPGSEIWIQDDMYSPLYNAYPYLEDRKKEFADYVERTIKAEWIYLNKRLRELGYKGGYDVQGSFDLIWFPPDVSNDGFPVPALVEAGVYPTDFSVLYPKVGGVKSEVRNDSKAKIWLNPNPPASIQKSEPGIHQRVLKDYEDLLQNVKKTPLVQLERISELTGKKVFLKNDAQQYGGSFKIRGVYWEVYSTIKTLLEKPNAKQILRRGFKIVTQSTGNHGIATIKSLELILAKLRAKYETSDPELAQLLFNIEPLIFTLKEIPEPKYPAMQQALRDYRKLAGENKGEIRNLYDTYESALKARKIFVAQQGDHAVYIRHASAETTFGYGSAGVEIAEQLKAAGIEENQKVVVIFPVGAGGPIGFAAGLRLARFDNTYAVMAQSDRWDAFVRSLQTGRLEKNEQPIEPTDVIKHPDGTETPIWFTDGSAVDAPEEFAIDLAKGHLDAAVAVDERAAYDFSGPLLLADLKDHMGDLARVGGTTALTAEALLTQAGNISVIQDADVVVLFGTEGSVSPYVHTHLENQLPQLNTIKARYQKRSSQVWGNAAYTAGHRNVSDAVDSDESQNIPELKNESEWLEYMELMLPGSENKILKPSLDKNDLPFPDKKVIVVVADDFNYGELEIINKGHEAAFKSSKQQANFVLVFPFPGNLYADNRQPGAPVYFQLGAFKDKKGNWVYGKFERPLEVDAVHFPYPSDDMWKILAPFRQKTQQKKFFTEKNIPTAPYVEFPARPELPSVDERTAEVQSFAAKHGGQVVMKPSDGYGGLGIRFFDFGTADAFNQELLREAADYSLSINRSKRSGLLEKRIKSPVYLKAEVPQDWNIRYVPVRGKDGRWKVDAKTLAYVRHAPYKNNAPVNVHLGAQRADIEEVFTQVFGDKKDEMFAKMDVAVRNLLDAHDEDVLENVSLFALDLIFDEEGNVYFMEENFGRVGGVYVLAEHFNQKQAAGHLADYLREQASAPSIRKDFNKEFYYFHPFESDVSNKRVALAFYRRASKDVDEPYSIENRIRDMSRAVQMVPSNYLYRFVLADLLMTAARYGEVIHLLDAMPLEGDLYLRAKYYDLLASQYMLELNELEDAHSRNGDKKADDIKKHRSLVLDLLSKAHADYSAALMRLKSSAKDGAKRDFFLDMIEKRAAFLQPFVDIKAYFSENGIEVEKRARPWEGLKQLATQLFNLEAKKHMSIPVLEPSAQRSLFIMLQRILSEFRGVYHFAEIVKGFHPRQVELIRQSVLDIKVYDDAFSNLANLSGWIDSNVENSDLAVAAAADVLDLLRKEGGLETVRQTIKTHIEEILKIFEEIDLLFPELTLSLEPRSEVRSFEDYQKAVAILVDKKDEVYKGLKLAARLDDSSKTPQSRLIDFRKLMDRQANSPGKMIGKVEVLNSLFKSFDNSHFMKGDPVHDSRPDYSILNRVIDGMSERHTDFPATEEMMERTAKITFEYFVYQTISLLAFRAYEDWRGASPESGRDMVARASMATVQKMLEDFSATSFQKFDTDPLLSLQFLSSYLSFYETEYYKLDKFIEILGPEALARWDEYTLRLIGRHLRGVFHDSYLLWNHRWINVADYALLILSLNRELARYQAAKQSGDEPAIKRHVQNILEGLSPDAAFLTKKKDMENLKRARDRVKDEYGEGSRIYPTDDPAVWESYWNLLGVLRKPLREDMIEYAEPAEFGYSALGRVDLYWAELAKYMILASILKPGNERLGFRDLLESDAARPAAFKDASEKLRWNWWIDYRGKNHIADPLDALRYYSQERAPVYFLNVLMALKPRSEVRNEKNLNDWRSEPGIKVLRGGKDGLGSSDDEQISLTDGKGLRNGKSAAKTEAHKKGLWHETAHGYFFYKDQIVLQVRSQKKKSSPGKFQVSISGHLNIEDKTVTDGLRREGQEESGILLNQMKIRQVSHENEIRRSYQSDEGMNNEFTTVYDYELDDNELEMIRQGYNLNEIDEFWVIPIPVFERMIEESPYLFSSSLIHLISQSRLIYEKMKARALENLQKTAGENAPSEKAVRNPFEVMNSEILRMFNQLQGMVTDPATPLSLRLLEKELKLIPYSKKLGRFDGKSLPAEESAALLVELAEQRNVLTGIKNNPAYQMDLKPGVAGLFDAHLQYLIGQIDVLTAILSPRTGTVTPDESPRSEVRPDADALRPQSSSGTGRSEVREKQNPPTMLSDLFGEKAKRVVDYATGLGDWPRELRGNSHKWLAVNSEMIPVDLDDPIEYPMYQKKGGFGSVKDYQRSNLNGLEVITPSTWDGFLEPDDAGKIKEIDLLHAAFLHNPPMTLNDLDKFETNVRVGGWVLIAHTNRLYHQNEMIKWLKGRGYEDGNIYVYDRDTGFPMDYPTTYWWNQYVRLRQNYIIVAQKTRNLFRSEVRENAKSVEARPIEKMSIPAGVFLDAKELVLMPVAQLDKQLDEILTLVSRHKAFDVYIDGADRLPVQQFKNPKIQKMLSEHSDQIHLGMHDRANLAKKQILIHASFLDGVGSREETQNLIEGLRKRYGIKAPVSALEYRQAGSLKAFLDLAERFKRGELIRDIGEAFAVLGPNGRWRVAQDFVATIWNQVQASYRIQWSA